MNILIINGPNLNMLGIREPEVYGTATYADLCGLIEAHAKKLGVAVTLYQSNHEGALVRLEYTQKPLSAYSINSDFFWYEIDDVITIGTKDIFYFCFPKNCGDVVTKARLAQEEIYKMHKGTK